MSNGKELINEMDYQQRIRAMKARELSEFTAMQVYENNLTMQDHEGRIIKLESPSKKRQATFGGSVIAFVTAIFYALGTKLGWWI